MIDLPAFSAEEDTNSFISVAHSDRSDLSDSHPEGGLLVCPDTDRLNDQNGEQYRHGAHSHGSFL